MRQARQNTTFGTEIASVRQHGDNCSAPSEFRTLPHCDAGDNMILNRLGSPPNGQALPACPADLFATGMPLGRWQA